MFFPKRRPFFPKTLYLQYSFIFGDSHFCKVIDFTMFCLFIIFPKTHFQKNTMSRGNPHFQLSDQKRQSEFPIIALFLRQFLCLKSIKRICILSSFSPSFSHHFPDEIPEISTIYPFLISKKKDQEKSRVGLFSRSLSSFNHLFGGKTVLPFWGKLGLPCDIVF